MKPIGKDPIKVMLLGILILIASALMEAYLPAPKEKSLDSQYLKATSTGLLALVGITLALWPIIKRAWSMWRDRKK